MHLREMRKRRSLTKCSVYGNMVVPSQVDGISGKQLCPSTDAPSHRISFIPGAEYISTCLWPFRNRNSMVPKSFLSRPMLLRNSVLNSMGISLGSEKELGSKWPQLTLRKTRSEAWHSVVVRKVACKSNFDGFSPRPSSCFLANISDRELAPLFAVRNISLRGLQLQESW
jgi:hypothetical protein